MSEVQVVTTCQTDPQAGFRCMVIWLRSKGYTTQADDLEAYAASEAQLRVAIEEICQQRATKALTRSRLRHALAGIDWRKAGPI